MSQDEQDRIFGRTSRELKDLKTEATAQKLEILRFGQILESLGKGLQLLPPYLTDEQKAALDAPKLTALLAEHTKTWEQIEKLERELKG